MHSPQMEILLSCYQLILIPGQGTVISGNKCVCVGAEGRGEGMHTINNLIFMFSEKQNKAPKFIENSSYDLFHILKLHVS